MTLRVDLYGPDHHGQERRPHVHRRGEHSGLVVFSDPFHERTQKVTPLVNETFGAAMNQDVSFNTPKNVIYAGAAASAKTGTADTDTTDACEDSGGVDFLTTVAIGMTVENTVDSNYARVDTVPSNIKATLTDIGEGDGSDIFPDGTDAYIFNATWAASGDASWDFTTDVSLTSGNNGDQAVFDADVKDLSLASDFVALSFTVDLGTYSASQHNLAIQLRRLTLPVGVAVNLNDYIDIGDFGSQAVIIPMADFELAVPTFNGLSFDVVRSGGSKPSLDIDDITMETGTAPISYRAVANPGTRFRIAQLVFTFVDALDIDRASASVPELSYDKILGDAALTNGIGINWVVDGVNRLSLSLRNIGDIMAAGGQLRNVIADGTNTSVQFVVDLVEPFVIQGAPEANYLEALIRDKMDTQLVFTIFARGGEEDL